MMAADYRHIGGRENRLGRHYSRFSGFWLMPSLQSNHLLCENRRTAGRIGEDGLSGDKLPGGGALEPTPPVGNRGPALGSPPWLEVRPDSPLEGSCVDALRGFRDTVGGLARLRNARSGQLLPRNRVRNGLAA